MATRKLSDKDKRDVLRALTKRFGEGYDERGFADPNAKAVPTGYDDLDVWLVKGAHGIYQGGIIEIMGSEGSGKTSLALRVVGNAQKEGQTCCWIDAEAAFSSDLARINGCNPEELVMPSLLDTKAAKTHPEDGFGLFNANEVLEMIYRSICADIFGFIVLDSVAGLIPDKVLGADYDPSKPAMPTEVPAAMARSLHKISQACRQTQTSVIFINQLRDKPGDFYQDRFHTPGGRALKFFAHQRISVEKRLGKEGKVSVPDAEGRPEVIGHYARTTVVKNKLAPPTPDGMSIDIPIYYREYFPDDAKKSYDIGRSLQVITMWKGILTWKDGDSILIKEDGEAPFLAKLRESDELVTRLIIDCCAAAQDERNTKKKVPVKVPKSLMELAEKAPQSLNSPADSASTSEPTESESDSESKGKTKTKKKVTAKKSAPRLDLDE